jgi:hypothetical protein
MALIVGLNTPFKNIRRVGKHKRKLKEKLKGS